MTAFARNHKVLIQRVAAVVMFIAVTVVAGVIALRNHDAIVNRTTLDAVTNAQIAAYVPPIKHVWVINIENENGDKAWGDGIDGSGNGGDPYLAGTLRSKGNLLTQYYSTAHNSEPNYIAELSGQGPNPEMQADCQNYTNMSSTGVGAYGQVTSPSGCIFPRNTPSIATELQRAGLSWKGYMDGMSTPCQHPVVGGADNTQKATATSEYATRHNPFMYFHDIIDSPALCKAHVVSLAAMPRDLATVTTTPHFNFITPDLCNDGHDAPCANGQPGGLKSVDAWMKVWIPRIMNSPAYRQDGAIFITADEAAFPTFDSVAGLVGSDSYCCGEKVQNTVQAGILSKGGGLIDMLVLSKWVKPGSFSDRPYNHYAFLASLEEIFRVTKTGYATDPGLDRFGLDVYNNGWR